jgi:hypothetical protein
MRSNQQLWALVRASALSTLLVGLGCGHARSDSSGSETHWLQSCQTDGDCAALGVACQGGFCATDEKVASDLPSGSLLPTASSAPEGDDALSDRSEDQTAGSEPTPSDARLAAELCDGSERARVIYNNTTGFAETDAYWFGPAYGPSYFVVDGQCRFWGGPSGSGLVFARVLDEGTAARLARAVHFGHQAVWSESDNYACETSEMITLWTPQGHVVCKCNCLERESPAGWSETFTILNTDPVRGDIGLFHDAQPVTGPARLLVYRSGVQSLDLSDLQPWPLARPPAQAELTRLANFGSWGGNWGVLLTDPDELRLLREARSRRDTQGGDWTLTPLAWTEGGAPVDLYMRLLDEIPAPLAADIERDLAQLP